MFVWIPRFSYSINEYHTEYTASEEGTEQQIFDITFLVGTSNKDKNGTSYSTDYNYDSVEVGEATPSIVHSAFTFDGQQISGFWSAKFEASMLETNLNTTTNNDSLEPTVKIVPNAETWRYINIGNSFGNCIEMNDSNNVYGITSNTESMLMLNSQWGAISYLTTSKYGTTPKINNYYTQDEDIYHSWAAEEDYINNYDQSTTGNIWGIYDMNGGSWERVASYFANGDINITLYGTTTYFDSTTKEIKAEYAKYWEEYEVSDLEKQSVIDGLWNEDSSYNSTRMQITEDRYNLMKNYKGDAMYEVISTYLYYGKTISEEYTWLKDEVSSASQYQGGTYYNSDYILIGNCALPFVYRGGGWYDNSGAGVFATGATGGDASGGLRGFRAVLVCE